jgi:hypothetical protein
MLGLDFAGQQISWLRNLQLGRVVYPRPTLIKASGVNHPSQLQISNHQINSQPADFRTCKSHLANHCRAFFWLCELLARERFRLRTFYLDAERKPVLFSCYRLDTNDAIPHSALFIRELPQAL